MVATLIEPTAPGRRPRRRLWLAMTLLMISPVVGVGTASWWFTAPLTTEASSTAAHTALASAPERPAASRLDPDPTGAEPLACDESVALASESASASALAWPDARLQGPAAKRLLLDILIEAEHRLNAIPNYTATLRKRERIHGTLGPEQTLAMKVRHHPFAIYLKFLAPKAGKEVVYAEGKHDNKLIAHAGDWTRRLVPRIAVAPTDPLALADNRHPITEAGIVNMTRKLISFRRLDLDDPEATVVLDRVTDEHGQEWCRSVHTHPRRKEARPYARIEVLYDPETLFPRRVANFDWPTEGSGTLELAESYAYDDLDLSANLHDDDFDPANPSYAFTRY